MPSRNTQRQLAGQAARAKASQPPEFGDPSLALQGLLSKNLPGNLKFIDVVIEGQLLRFHYKPLGWVAKNACLSKAQGFEPAIDPKTGQGIVQPSLHHDRYLVEALRRMLVDPPIPITDKTLDALDAEAGAAFESIIPPLFDTEIVSENLKKKYEESSQDGNP